MVRRPSPMTVSTVTAVVLGVVALAVSVGAYKFLAWLLPECR